MSDHVYPRTDWTTSSYSELACLAACEEKWRRRYVLGEPTETGAAQIKGSLWHEGTGALLANSGDISTAYPVMLDLAVAEWGDSPTWTEEQGQTYADAVWLVERYARHYAVQLKQVKVVANELRLTREMMYPTRDGLKGVTIKSDLDSLLDFDGKLWLREGKSSGKKDVLDTAQISPQVSLYWWQTEGVDVLADLGYPEGLYGVLFDFAYTYRWKPEKPTQKVLIEDEEEAAKREGRPTVWSIHATGPVSKAKTEWARHAVARHPGIERSDSESFEQIWLDRTPAQIQMGERWAQSILERRYNLTQSLPDAPTIRNLGPSCKFCDHRTGCYEEMAFDQEPIMLVAE